MIDHVLGRPSKHFRKVQVLLVVGFWSLYLIGGDKHGPPIFRNFSQRLSRKLTTWQTIVMTMLWLYFARNFAKVMNLECPEPLANLYSKSYFRATWVATALDAGYWTAMPIKWNWLRELAGPVFTIYYLLAAEQADEKVRKVRATITLDHMRVSWNKGTTPILSTLQKLFLPRSGITPRNIKIARPRESAYRDPIEAVLYFQGTRAELFKCQKVVLDIPGGGFVAMTPRNHDDKSISWAKSLGVPVISINYKKAPEFPYPYALNECYDVYHSIVQSNGQCVGLSGEVRPKIAMIGDSAGGNFVVGVTLMILNTVGTNARFREQEVQSLPLPEGLVLIYPSLDMNIGSWMSEEQMSLIRDRNTRKINRNVVRRKSEYFAKTSGIRSVNASDSDDDDTPPFSKEGSIASATLKDRPVKDILPAATDSEHKVMSTRLATTSRISYFNDRILTPEMMRAMVILYVGPHNRPDFTTDFLLSPIVAPDSLLQMFPKCYFLTGERDPLVDDTVIFAGRLRRAKLDAWKHRKDLGLTKGVFDEKSCFEISLIPGVSHGFLQMGAFFPGAWREIKKCGRWLGEILDENAVNMNQDNWTNKGDYFSSPHHSSSSSTTPTSGYDAMSPHPNGRPRGLSMDDERPLEIGMTATTHGRATKNRHGRGGVGGGGSGRTRRNQINGDVRGPADGSNVVGPGSISKDDRSKSELSLTSEDDLVGRRMQGLAGSLGGFQG